MANTLTIKQSGLVWKQKRVRYNLALSGLYVQAVPGSNVGEVLIPGNAVGKYDPDQYWGYEGPSFGNATQPPQGYGAQILPGADSQHWLLRLFSSPGTELAAGAYSAGVLADLYAYIEFWGGDFK